MARILFIVPLLAVMVLAVTGRSALSELEERLMEELEGKTSNKRHLEEEQRLQAEIEEKTSYKRHLEKEQRILAIKEREEEERRTVYVCGSRGIGGNGGDCFNDKAAFIASGEHDITGFQVRAGDLVDCFGVIYGDKDGYCHGGQGGELHQETFAPNEHIVSLSGGAGNVLDSITVHTNVKTYGPYGGPGGQSYSLSDYGKIAYISGQAGALVDQITVYFSC